MHMGVLFILFSFNHRSVMLDRAETVLHDHYAGKDYWDVSPSTNI